MAIIERPSSRPRHRRRRRRARTGHPVAGLGVFRRPVSTTGWKSWLFTVDHKKLGIMYGVVALFFFLVGGVEALLIRLQLAGARQHGAQRRPLQRDVHDARHHHGVPVRDADGGGVRQLLPAAADRRPRRRVPPHQRVRLLAVPVRRHLPEHVVVPRRRGRRRLVHVLAEHQRAVLAQPRHRLLGARPADHRHRLAGRCHQPDRHRPQHAGARHEADAACRCSPG